MNAKNDTRSYVTKRFRELYQEKWEGKGKKASEFADAIREIIPESPCDYKYVSKWKTGYMSPVKYLSAICKVLEVDISEFSPKTHADKYQYSPDYANGLEGRLEQLAEQNVKIDLTFFQGLRNIIPDFDEIYPIYRPLTLREYDSKNEYYKRPIPAEASETSDGKGLFQLERDGKTVFMSKYDLKIIKVLQASIKKNVINWFRQVDEKLKKAEADAVQTYIEKNSDIWIHQVLDETELQEIDPYGMYTPEEFEKFHIPEGPIYTDETEG